MDGDRRRFAFFNVLLFAVFFYELVPPFIVGKIVDFFAVYRPGMSLEPFYGYVAFLSVTWGVVSLVRQWCKSQLTRIGIALRSRVKVAGFERLTDASLAWHAEENTGNKVQRILTGSQAFFEAIKISSSNLYPIAANFIGVTLFFFTTSPSLLLFLLAYNLVFFSIQFFFNERIERLSLSYNKAIERSSGTFFEATGNILSIKAIGAEKHMHSRVATDEETAKGYQLSISAQNTNKWRSFQLWNACSFAIFLLLVGRGVVAGTISVGAILVLYTYFNKLRESANDTNDISTTLISVKADLARLVPLFDEQPPTRTGSKGFPEGWKKITLKDAHFSYPKGERGLHNISLAIDRGARIGIAGSSGAGKSTLLKLFLGLYELDRGAFKIGSTDFYAIDHAEIAKHIAVVLQETELFNLSFRDNVTVMRDVDPLLLERAIDVADLRDVIARLPEGLDTEIGERGYALSGGERQRIGIAVQFTKTVRLSCSTRRLLPSIVRLRKT